MDHTSAAMTIYEGAIYLVQAAPWQVEQLDWEGRQAFVRHTEADYYTAMHHIAALLAMTEPYDLGRVVGNSDTTWFAIVDLKCVEAIKRLAKYHEHMRRDYQSALELTSQIKTLDRDQSAHRQREQRLRAKLSR